MSRKPVLEYSLFTVVEAQNLSVPINVKVPIKVIEKMGFLDLLNTFFGSNS